MNKHYAFVSLIFLITCIVGNSSGQVPEGYKRNLNQYQEVTIDVTSLKNEVANAPMKGLIKENRNSPVIVDLPMPDGSYQAFRVVESPILSPELSIQRPAFKSYAAKGIDDPTATTRFNITPAGFYGVIFGINGVSIIESLDKTGTSDQYITYYDHDITSTSEINTCESEDELINANTNSASEMMTNSCFQNGANLRTYQMVVTCSGEFYQLNGNTAPLAEAALLARVTQINTIYEVELAITFTIAEYLLNSDPSTDVFTDPTNTSTSITQAEDYINNNVTVGTWDIGHGFHEITCGGSCSWAGRAGLGVVCTTSKARGYTYLPNDIPTSVTVLLHEIGHMFSCRHTNYGCDTENNCGRYEPGRGSSIMSTSAGCDAGDFFANRTDYFGIGSLQAIIDYTSTGTVLNNNSSCTTSTTGGWSDCSATSGTGNNMPTSDANANSINGLTIPHSTPFTLSGTGSDPDGTGSLTYVWEQYDTDYAGSAAPDDTGTSTTAPQFRSFPPSTSNERSCPQLSSVLAGNVTTGTGEVLPTVSRTLAWRLVVRDNEVGGGGIACDEISLTVGSDGPFQITSQNTTTAWSASATETVTWDVANTDGGAYTCPNVDILYSSDGGTTFGTTLASSVTNDGSQTITVPGTATTTGRIKIVCSGGTNIFFDINNADIAVVVGCDAEGGAISNSDAVSAPEGDASLNLSLCAGVAITSVTGVLNSGDLNSNLAVENDGMGTCTSLGNNPKYETLEFSVDVAASVTFTRTSQGDYTSMITLYEDSYDPNNECTNWLNSNGDYDPNVPIVNVSSNFSEALVTGTKYVLLPSAFSTSTPSTGNYEVNFSETLYNTEPLTPTGYLYTYVIVNTGTGNIVAFDANSDLSNSGTFPQGSYDVYGLSYLLSENLAVYVGGAFTTLQTDVGNSTICGDLSTNSVAVTITVSLPIELLSFTGNQQNESILLNWKTASEINNDFFTLEHSIDGYNFKFLTEVDGKGNSTITNDYRYIHENPTVGTNYYRLSQTDFDGTIKVEDVIAVDYKSDVVVATVIPNPIRQNEINLQYISPQATEVDIEVIDMTGKVLIQTTVSVSTGENNIQLPVQNWSGGVYYLRTIQNQTIKSIKFVKMN
ncbi:MAG: M12 family metallo-peptidase [Saprospiraceae bacterium]